MRRILYAHVRIGWGALMFLVFAGAWILYSGEAQRPDLRAASQAVLRKATGQPQLISVEPLPVMDGDICQWVPARNWSRAVAPTAIDST